MSKLQKSVLLTKNCSDLSLNNFFLTITILVTKYQFFLCITQQLLGFIFFPFFQKPSDLKGKSLHWPKITNVLKSKDTFESLNFTYSINNVSNCQLDFEFNMNGKDALFSFMKNREFLWLKGPLLYFLSIVFLFCVTKQLSGVLKSSACAEEQNGRFLSI